MTTLLNIENLVTCFMSDKREIKILDDVSIRLAPGEIIGVVGESGSGKSVTMLSLSLIHILSGIYDNRYTVCCYRPENKLGIKRELREVVSCAKVKRINPNAET